MKKRYCYNNCKNEPFVKNDKVVKNLWNVSEEYHDCHETDR